MPVGVAAPPSHFDLHARMQFDRTPPVAPDHAVRWGDVEDLDHDGRGRAEHQRPREEGVRAEGHHNSASTPGQITGPPAEKAYAVEPVGVETSIPSQAQRDSGRPSTSTSTSSIRSRAAFSIETSLIAYDDHSDLYVLIRGA